MNKKITLATIKSFIKAAGENLYISNKSSFDGMVDCVMPSDDKGFHNVTPSTFNEKHTMGIKGAWFVGRSHDYFTAYENASYKGIEVNNCCDSFILAIAK